MGSWILRFVSGQRLRHGFGYEETVVIEERTDYGLGEVFRKFGLVFGVDDRDPRCFPYRAVVGSCRNQSSGTCYSRFACRVCKEHSSLFHVRSTSFRDCLNFLPADEQIRGQYLCVLRVMASKNGYSYV